MKINILSKDYKFQELEVFSRDDLGVSSMKDLIINICSSMPKQAKEESLLHEIMHQVADQLGIILDESVISSLSSGLYTCSAVKVLYPRKDK